MEPLPAHPDLPRDAPTAIPLEEENESKTSSPFGCFLNLANVALGVGTLSLPAVFAKVGWGGGMFLISLTCTCSSYSLYMLVKCAQVTRAYSYTDLAQKVLGAKSAMVSWTFFVMVMGALAAYVSVIQEYSTTLMRLCYQSMHRPMPASAVPVLMAVLIGGLIFPLSLARNMSKLAFTSSLSLLCLLYVSWLVPWSFFRDLQRPDFIEPDTEGWILDRRFLFAWSTMSMAFVNHSNVIEICRELTAAYRHARFQRLHACGSCHLPPKRTVPPDPTLPSGSMESAPLLASSPTSISSTCSCAYVLKSPLPRPWITQASLIILTGIFVSSVYLMVGLGGYLHYGDAVQPNILSSEPLGPPFILARAGILVCMVFSFPLLVLPSRICLEQLVRDSRIGRSWLGEDPAPNAVQEAWIPVKVILIISFAIGISVMVPALDQILGITGSLAGSLIVYIFPAYFYLRLTKQQKLPRRQALHGFAYVNVGLGSTLLLIGSLSTILSIPA